MKRLRTTLLTLCTLAALLLAVAASSRLYTANDGLSSSKTTCLMQDAHGFLWVGTEYGLNRFDGYRHTTFLNAPGDTTSLPDNEVTCFLNDRQGRLWVGLNKGLARYRPDTNDFLTLHFPSHLRPRVESLAETPDGTLLVGTAGYGLFTIDSAGTTVERRREFTRTAPDEFASRLHISPDGTLLRGSHLPTLITMRLAHGGKQSERLTPSTITDAQLGDAGPVVKYIDISTRARSEELLVCTYGILRCTHHADTHTPPTLASAGYDLSAIGGKASIRTAAIGHDGTLYVGTSGRGIFLAPKGSKAFQPLKAQATGFDLATANVNDIIEDKDGNLWASCYNKGIFQLSAAHTAFTTSTFAEQDVRLGSSVSSIAPDGEGGAWLTVQKSGIYHMAADGRVTAQRTQPDGANTIHRDAQGRYWLGTEGELYLYDTATGAAERKLTLDGWGVNCMADDGHGTLYVSNFGKGLIAYDTRTGQQRAHSMQQRGARGGQLANDWVKALLCTTDGRLLAGCADGLSLFDPATQTFRTYQAFKGKQCLSLAQHGPCHALVGTDKGLYRLDTASGKAAPFDHADQLGTTAVYAIVEDRTGDLWLSTAMGIWQYDHRARRWLGHIGGSGLTAREYVIGAALHDSQTDRITFGIGDGITSFRPDDVRHSTTTVGNPHLSRLVIGGKEMGVVNSVYQIDYQDNTLTLEFSLLNFHDTDNVTFDYRLNDNEPWATIADGGNAITLTKLEPGTYHLAVRASAGGQQSAQPLRLTLCVAHPWYASPVAWVLYVIAAIAVAALVIYWVERRRTVRTEEAKMRFLINATHDIRSPLTLILAPLEKLRARLADQESQDDIDTIDRNARRLLLLVNQILDERRIDKNQMRLHCQPTDLVAQVQGVCSMYQYNAHQRRITLTIDHQGDVPQVWLDRQQFDKVLANLLSNAFKYTLDGGEIRFRITHDATTVTLSLTDTGPGLRENKPERLFERFYQGRNAQTLHVEGTGIGLNLSRAIVQLHGGTITAHNRTDGPSGATFEVRLPQGHSHLPQASIEPREDDTSANPQLAPTDKTPQRKKAQHNRAQRILIVDDDSELASYVATELSPWFKADTCGDGQQALDRLLRQSYDLVVSDVVMPHMDGLHLLRTIKTNPQLSHIPVILLTSKSEADHRVEGLKKGADGYIAKPFNMDELQAMATNLIDNVQRLRGKFSGAQQQEQRREHIEVKGNDDALMERIMRSLNAHLSDPDFRVDSLTQDVGISRAQLHRKLKEMTGLPAGEFIRNLRMDEAARLLAEGKVSVTQVAYAVGFTSQSHFSTAFHKRFGLTPKEYAEGKGETEK